MSNWFSKVSKEALSSPPPPKPPLSSGSKHAPLNPPWLQKLATVESTFGRKHLKPSNVPHDDDAEQAVLGAILMEGRAIQVARQFLTPKHFYKASHQHVFAAALKLAEAGTVVDVVTMASKLRDTGHLETWVTLPDLAEFINKVTSPAHVEHYAKIVAGFYLEREIIATCNELALKQTNEALEKLRTLHLEKEALSAPFMFNYQTGLHDILDLLSTPDKSPVFSTHFPTVDACWHGIKRGEINTWAAATNEGKSVLLLNLLDRAAMAGKRCLYVGTEMTAIETVSRHLSIQSNIEAWRIRKPDLHQPHLKKLHETMAEVMSKMTVSILDDPEPDMAKIESAIYSCKPDIVFLDYLERFNMPRAESLRLQIKEFMRRLKTMARRNQVVVHLAAQLNREVYGSEERAPTLADLSESSAIEKESDRVVLLWAPRGILKRKPSEQVDSAPLKLKEHHRLIQGNCAKNRHGPKGLSFEFVLNEINLKVMESKEYSDPFNSRIEEE